jgi:hypothetical protein
MQQIIHLMGSLHSVPNRSGATNNKFDGQLAFGSQIVAVQQIIYLMGSLHLNANTLNQE